MARPKKYITDSLLASDVAPEPQEQDADGPETEALPAPKGTATTPAQRFFPGQQDIISDLFKLEVAFMMKNKAFQEGQEDWVKVEHCHFYRTIDSSGRKLYTSDSVGGHFHQVTTQTNPDGSVQVTTSGPMKWVKKKVKGQWQRVMQPVDKDEHRHTLNYERSHSLKARTINPEAAKYIAIVGAEPATPAGIVER